MRRSGQRNHLELRRRHTAQEISQESPDATALRTPPPPPWARRAGHVAWIAPVLGFIPLHIPWILGIPLFANPDPFREWYHGRGPGVGDHPVDGFLGLPAGAFYLSILCILAGLGGVLALGLISDWGLVFPRWIPVLRGHRVPRWLPLTPTVLGSALMIGYAVTLPWQFAAERADASPGDDIFTTPGVLIGLPLLLAWAIALPMAGWSYYRRTRAPRR
ncbi:hypothetical protein [Micromonospora sp. AMSO31t]|uniref:hypothetical protein n=1 Tax=Micromonospora sp. AMSO31t TaxID=2650566 RepID=UPI00124B86E6|nr:hypothetical protein [Micromonospora sp. AMSO31t]KAB1911281.1 hypothetical protein F8274_17895 [Micromonospora sp. AMSO31t]